MNRRLFLRSLLGTGAGLAVAPVLPSEVWPFRKIFLPAFRDILDIFGTGKYDGRWLSESAIQAIELESFEKQIPGLIESQSFSYYFITKNGYTTVPSPANVLLKSDFPLKVTLSVSGSSWDAVPIEGKILS